MTDNSNQKGDSMNLSGPPRSGRRGEWVYYMRGNKQCRRRYVRPRDPRTPAQLRVRQTFGAASKAWSSPGLSPQERQAVREQGDDLTAWLDYCAEGLLLTLERVWTRVQKFAAKMKQKKLVLRPKQEQLLQLLRDRNSLTPREIWDALAVSKPHSLVNTGFNRRPCPA